MGRVGQGTSPWRAGRPPPWAHAPRVWGETLKGGAPPCLGGKPPSPGAALSLPNTSSTSVVLGEAVPENCKLHHHAVVLLELSLNFSSPLAG